MKAVLAFGKKLYQLEIWVMDFLKHPFLLILRLYFGWAFIIAGWGKLQNIKEAAHYFASLHIPMPTLNAYLAGGTETICGGLLLIGFASRIITIPLIVTMIVAYTTAHKEQFDALFDSDTRALFFKAPPFPYLFTCLVVLLFGPGYLSVDGLLKWLLGRQRGPAAVAAPPASAVPAARTVT